MLKARNIKIGFVIEHNGKKYRVLEATYAQTCQSEPSMTLRLKDIFDGKILKVSAGAHETFNQVYIIEQNDWSFLKRDANDFNLGVFINNDTMEMISIPFGKVDHSEFLNKEMECPVSLVFISDKSGEPQLISVDLPEVLKVKVAEIHSESSGGKVVRIQSEFTSPSINVPSYIQVGEIIKIHKSTKEFIGRA